jgi:hypothetical protein
MMNDSTTVALFLVTGLLIYGVLRLGEAGYLKFKRLSQSFVFLVDTDANTAIPRWVTLSEGNKYRYKLDGEDRTAILPGKTRLGSSAWVLHMRTGLTYELPSETERLAPGGIVDKALLLATAFDPLSYAKAEATNEWGSAMRAGEDDDKYSWLPLVAVVSLIGIIVVGGMLVYVITKMGPHAVGGG